MDTTKVSDVEFDKWKKVLLHITVGLFLATVLIEVGVSFMMYFQGLIEQEIPEYIRLYVLTPVSISGLILLIGSIYVRKVCDSLRTYRAYVLMITLMFGNLVFVHNAYMILLYIFCIPISLTVILQDRILLNWVVGISEFFVIGTGLHCVFNQEGAGTSPLYLPSVIIAAINLFATAVIARTSIQILIEKNRMLEQAIEDAKAADRSKSMFLSNMSHEIRTPINAVLGMDEMILREATDPQIIEYAQDIQSSGRTLLGLINDILDFSKIEEGKLDIVMAEYDISTVINDLIVTISGRALNKGLNFETDIAPDIPHVLLGDEIRIKQIAINILTNAVKYTEKGTVKFSVRSEKVDDNHAKLCFSVADTGQGMRPEDLERLFVRFERINEKQNRHIEGTGLGMTITKGLLDRMGSTLQVESEWGKGSTFSFELVQEVRNWEPIGDYVRAIRKGKQQSKATKAMFTAPDARILVVDDARLNLKVIAGLLKRNKIQVETASSGLECINKATVTNYDLMFIDHMMPEMDGIETLQKLQELSDYPNKTTPKIALTANAIAGSRELYLGAGFTEYMSKPVEGAKLEQMLMQFLPKEKIILPGEEEENESCECLYN